VTKSFLAHDAIGISNTTPASASEPAARTVKDSWRHAGNCREGVFVSAEVVVFPGTPIRTRLAGVLREQLDQLFRLSDRQPIQDERERVDEAKNRGTSACSKFFRAHPIQDHDQGGLRRFGTEGGLRLKFDIAGLSAGFLI
jgi:hypothetical protein